MSENNKAPSLIDALVPILVLVSLLTASVVIYGDNSSYGPNQIALLVSAGVAVIIAMKNGFAWSTLEKAMVNGISLSLGAVLILLAVGSLIGTWLLSGTVPTLIYYGLQLLHPSVFYAASCIICGIVAMSIGSSWTTAATIGVALMGVSSGLGMDSAITAGAIISGAYFGDKLSPLSETTNLAPAVAGSELFSHIRHMLWTTIPSITVALVIFIILGLSADVSVEAGKIEALKAQLEGQFDLGVHLLIPLIVLLTMAVKRMPAFPAVFIGALLGGVWAVLFQGDMVAKLAGDDSVLGAIKVVWTALFDGVTIETGDADLNDLLSGGGMSKMLNTIWLITCAMVYGAVLEKTGMLKRVVQGLLEGAKSVGSLITSTVATCIGVNLVTSDQYMSIVMTGRMYKEEYERRGLDNLNLSRTLEDAGTITSPLIPWNTCGAYMQSVLLVNPLEYLFYCFFNLLSPLLAIIYGFLHFKILKRSPSVASDNAVA